MKLVLVILLSLLALNTQGQIADNTNQHNDRNIYYQALVQYLKFRSGDSFYAKYPIDTLFVQKEYNLTDSLLDNIGSVKIVLVGDVYKLIKDRNWEGITLYKFFPLTYNNGEFYVGFNPYDTTARRRFRRKEIHHSFSCTIQVFFKLEHGQFSFIRLRRNCI